MESELLPLTTLAPDILAELQRIARKPNEEIHFV